VEEIFGAVTEYVARERGGEWPEDAWFDLGSEWSVNVWTWEDSSDRRITVYRDFVGRSGYRETDTSAGISLQYSKMWSRN
jgi:hypothetical protein